jgi:hypothetical protein
MIKTYSELIRLPTFEERFAYLNLDGIVGNATFGSNRILNQRFYKSQPWFKARNDVLVRDNGCDLGVEDRLIGGMILVHHMNPLNIDDIVQLKPIAIDPEYLISISFNTHNAVHYGDETLLIKEFKERTPEDTKLW